MSSGLSSTATIGLSIGIVAVVAVLIVVSMVTNNRIAHKAQIKKDLETIGSDLRKSQVDPNLMVMMTPANGTPGDSPMSAATTSISVSTSTAGTPHTTMPMGGFTEPKRDMVNVKTTENGFEAEGDLAGKSDKKEYAQIMNMFGFKNQ